MQKVTFEVVIKDVDPFAEVIICNHDEAAEMQRRVVKALSREFSQTSKFFTKKDSHPFDVKLIKKTEVRTCK